jgi:hypothetical protein
MEKKGEDTMKHFTIITIITIAAIGMVTPPAITEEIFWSKFRVSTNELIRVDKKDFTERALNAMRGIAKGESYVTTFTHFRKSKDLLINYQAVKCNILGVEVPMSFIYISNADSNNFVGFMQKAQHISPELMDIIVHARDELGRNMLDYTQTLLKIVQHPEKKENLITIQNYIVRNTVLGEYINK